MVSLKLPSISLCNAIKKQTNFQLQQPPLGLSAIGEANKFTIGSDNAVAGNDEWQVSGCREWSGFIDHWHTKKVPVPMMEPAPFGLR